MEAAALQLSKPNLFGRSFLVALCSFLPAILIVLLYVIADSQLRALAGQTSRSKEELRNTKSDLSLKSSELRVKGQELQAAQNENRQALQKVAVLQDKLSVLEASPGHHLMSNIMAIKLNQKFVKENSQLKSELYTSNKSLEYVKKVLKQTEGNLQSKTVTIAHIAKELGDSKAKLARQAFVDAATAGVSLDKTSSARLQACVSDGANYGKLGNWRKAAESLTTAESLLIEKPNMDTRQLAIVRLQAGISYMKLGDYSQAEFLFKSVAASDADSRIKVSAYFNLGKLLEQKKSFDTALTYLTKALELSRSLDDVKEVYEIEFELAKLFDLLGKKAEAAQYRKSAMNGIWKETLTIFDNLDKKASPGH